MKNIFAIIGLIIVAALAGVVVAKVFFPTVKIIKPPPEIVHVDKFITKRDTITVERPVIRTVFKTVTELVRDTIYVPRDFRGIGVISPSPLKFEGGNVVITYFSLTDTSFIQDRYKVPRLSTSYYLSAITGFDPIRGDFAVGFEGAVRFRAITGFSRIFTTGTYNSLTIGVRIRLLGVE